MGSLKIETASKSGDVALNTSVSLARWQQDKEAVTGVGIAFWSPLSSAQTPPQYH